MPTWAIIPVKRLRDSKRRLEHLLSPDERAGLIFSFLDNLLSVLDEVPGIDHTLVITGDPGVIALADEHEAELLLEDRPAGLNAAVSRGVDHAIQQGASAILVLPADLPFARVEDIELMLRPLDDVTVSVAALTGDILDTGTNALLLAPPGDFFFHYGPGSLQAHLDEAQAHGRAIYLVNAPGLRFDLDTESDWLVYNGYVVMVADE